MKTIPVILGLVMLAAAGFQAIERFSFSNEESTMTVSGTSTIHDWSCEVSRIEGFADITGTSVEGATVTVKVEDIECGKRVMNNKLQDALRSKDHPTVTFKATEVTQDGDSWLAKGVLSIAGSQHQVEVPLTGTQEAGKYHFQGQVELSLESMNIDRPSAMLGTVKTGDVVTVAFSIVANS